MDEKYLAIKDKKNSEKTAKYNYILCKTHRLYKRKQSMIVHINM